MTRKMVMVFLNGQMEDDLKECGRMESRMEKESSSVLPWEKHEKDIGKMGKE